MKNVGAVFAAALVLLLAVSAASAQAGSGNVSEMAQKAEQTAKRPARLQDRWNRQPNSYRI